MGRHRSLRETWYCEDFDGYKNDDALLKAISKWWCQKQEEALPGGAVLKVIIFEWDDEGARAGVYYGVVSADLISKIIKLAGKKESHPTRPFKLDKQAIPSN